MLKFCYFKHKCLENKFNMLSFLGAGGSSVLSCLQGLFLALHTQGSFVGLLRDHVWCLKLNLYWLHARQVSYLSQYCSSPLNILFILVSQIENLEKHNWGACSWLFMAHVVHCMQAFHSSPLSYLPTKSNSWSLHCEWDTIVFQKYANFEHFFVVDLLLWTIIWLCS